MYKIWKASITHYRVMNVATGKVAVLENFSLFNCRFRVDVDRYNEAKECDFVNSGREDDYFAWIEADEVRVTLATDKDKNVFYNPFKSMWFTDRATGNLVSMAKEVVVKGNKLSYA